MAVDDEEFEASQESHADFVPVIVARSVEQAEQYRELLDEHDIPAIVDTERAAANGKEPRPSSARGIPILVPEALLEEASEVLAECEELGEDEFEAAGEEEELEEEETEEDEEEGELELEEGPGEEDPPDEEDEFLEEDEEEPGDEEPKG